MTSTKRNSYLFHPFELAFCGYSNSGKSTLIGKLLRLLKNEFEVGYVKHDVHRFQMDKEGKDTYTAWENGASQVFISDPRHAATIYKGIPERVEMISALIKNDFIFLEGYKNSPAPKIVVLDKEAKILSAVESGEIDSVIAYVGPDTEPETLPSRAPFFHRDDVEGILTFVKSYFDQKISCTPFYGLVLTGGRSTRMESDKALLHYSGKAQAQVCFDLLNKFCEKTWISSRPNQWDNTDLDVLPQIHDTYLDCGPMGGILSAMQKYPQAAWLVVACDLPFLSSDTLDFLIRNRNSFKIATCFESEKNSLPEPLCAVYEPKAAIRLHQFLSIGINCPRKVLIQSPTSRLKQLSSRSLDNINTREEYRSVKSQFESERMV